MLRAHLDEPLLAAPAPPAHSVSEEDAPRRQEPPFDLQQALLGETAHSTAHPGWAVSCEPEMVK